MSQVRGSTEAPSSLLRTFLFTDASYKVETRSAGWAACVIDGSYNRVLSGICPRPLDGSVEAEFYALGNGLKIAAMTGFLRPGVELMVGVDCEALVNLRRYRERSGIRSLVAQYAHKISEELGFEMNIYHVKAHVKARLRDEHQKINDIVDRRAHARMLERHQAILASRCPRLPTILPDLASYEGMQAASPA